MSLLLRYLQDMHGVTTALVGFIFVCVVFPNLVRNKPQFYAGLMLVILIILLDGLGRLVAPQAGLAVLAYLLGAMLQAGAILLLFLSAGGITWRELAGDMKQAIEVIRRGREEKEIIIPLSGQTPVRRTDPEEDDDAPPRIRLDDPSPPSDKPAS